MIRADVEDWHTNDHEQDMNDRWDRRSNDRFGSDGIRHVSRTVRVVIAVIDPNMDPVLNDKKKRNDINDCHFFFLLGIDHEQTATIVARNKWT